jgi:hypothetical protein
MQAAPELGAVGTEPVIAVAMSLKFVFTCDEDITVFVVNVLGIV